MIAKIFFFVYVPFNQRDFERFGIELLQKNGFDVEVWDLSNIPNPAIGYTPPDPIDWSGCKTFDDMDYAVKKIRSLSSDIFIINFIPYSPEFYCIYKAISSSQAGYAVFMANALPSPVSNRKESIFCRIKKLRNVNCIKNLVKSNFITVSRQFTKLRVKPASIILAGGEQCLKYPYPTDKTTEVLWAHTLDYDRYLKERDIPFTERPVAVFLDEYLPFHPDYVILGIQPYTTADRYYPLLNNFFNLVEQKLGLNVVIAAHPRSHYEELPDYFEGRECVRGKTIRLVKESQLVLAHCSTSLNFTNLFYKPVIFLTSRDLDNSPQGPCIKAMASWHGKNPIFMDGNINIDWERELMVSASCYDRYRRAYIKTEHSEDLPFWQIVANRIRKGR